MPSSDHGIRVDEEVKCFIKAPSKEKGHDVGPSHSGDIEIKFQWYVAFAELPSEKDNDIGSKKERRGWTGRINKAKFDGHFKFS